MSVPRIIGGTALGLVSILAIAGCASQPAAKTDDKAPSATTVTVEDNHGKHEISLPAASVVATDNRTFQTLSDWGIELKAAARALMPATNPYKTDESIIDLGNHNEPDLDAVVVAEPDLIITGQRFAQYYKDLAELAPDATLIELDPRDGEPFDAELKRQVTVLGEIFSKQDEAKKLVDDFDAAIERAKAAYDEADSVMAVNTSGGTIGYIAPTVGRTLGPIFDLLELTPALEVDDATDDHQGDEISVEAIAKSNPSWILVMDRDAAVAADDANYVQAAEILVGSEALASVDAIKNEQVVYMPADTYTNESIQTYTKFLNDFADALEAAQN